MLLNLFYNFMPQVGSNSPQAYEAACTPLGVDVPLFFESDSTNKLSLTPFFFFNDTGTPEIYTLSLPDALPICVPQEAVRLQLREPVVQLPQRCAQVIVH